jgi:hypothetical protein
MSKEKQKHFIRRVKHALDNNDGLTAREYVEALNDILDEIEASRDAARDDMVLEESGR